MFEAVVNKIAAYPRVILHRHSRPDGDALGSQMGLFHLIRVNYPDKEVFVVGDMTPRYAFIPGRPMDEIDDSAYKEALAIVLDTASSPLISDSRYTTAAATARLDHHIFCETITETEVVDTSFESCCGLVTAMAMEAGWTLTPEAAAALFAGTVTDSGRFRYDSTTAATFTRVAWLCSVPFDTNAVYSALYADELARVQLRASYVMKIQQASPAVAYIFTDKEALAATGADCFTISRGMVNTMSDIKGITVWVNFTETDEGILTELRSSAYNINPIAVKYGGGGHAKASGATLKTRDEIKAMLADLVALTERPADKEN